MTFLDTKEKQEAALVNHKWFDTVYKNPKNLKNLSLMFANCYLDDDEYPANLYVNSNIDIPYRRIVITNGVQFGKTEKFFAKMGKTVVELILKRDTKGGGSNRFPLNGDRIAFILEHLQHLKRLEIVWGNHLVFLRRQTLLEGNNFMDVSATLNNITEFKLIAKDVTQHQFLSLIQAMKNLESLHLEVYLSTDMKDGGEAKALGWSTIVKAVELRKTTLKHLFFDYRWLGPSMTEVCNHKSAVVAQLAKMNGLELKSFGISLPFQCYALGDFLESQKSITTFGALFSLGNCKRPAPMHRTNLELVVRHLPNLQKLYVEVTGKPLRGMNMFHHLKHLEALNVTVDHFDYGYHAFHSSNQNINYQNIIIRPKLTSLSILGGNMSVNDQLPSCLSCFLFMSKSFPNITHLELMLNSAESFTDFDLQIIFYHLTKLESLGISCCRAITDDAFTGKRSIGSMVSTKKRQIDEYAISNLKHLHTLVLFTLEQISDIAFIDGFAKLRNLKNFIIGNVPFLEGSGIEALVDGCEKLEVLEMFGCDNFDDDYVKLLINRLKYLYVMKLCGSKNFSEAPCKIFDGLKYICNDAGMCSYLYNAHNDYKVSHQVFPLNLSVAEPL